jgi:hypothetical protein
MWNKIYERQGSSLRLRDPPSRALRTQNWSKVEKRKVKEMQLEISLPTMPVGEQENVRLSYAGPPPCVFWAEMLSVPEVIRNRTRFLHWMADQFTGPHSSVEGLTHSVLAHSFRWPCCPVDGWHAEGHGRSVPSWVSQPTLWCISSHSYMPPQQEAEDWKQSYSLSPLRTTTPTKARDAG